MRNLINLVESYARPEYLYHGTSQRLIGYIFKEGLNAPSYWGNLEIARDYMHQHGEDGVMIRKPISAFSEDGLGINENLADINSHDDEDFVYPTTWLESLEICESVVYHYRMTIFADDFCDPYSQSITEGTGKHLEFVGTCADSFDEDGDCINPALPWSHVSDFAVADENATATDPTQFGVKTPFDFFDLGRGIYAAYDSDADIHYFYS